MNSSLLQDSATCDNSLILQSKLDFVLANASPDERPYLEVSIYGKSLLGLLDSGASRTILGASGYEYFKNLGIPLQSSSVKDCSVANGGRCGVSGMVRLPIVLRGKICILDVLVVPSLSYNLILGTDFWKSMGIVPDLRHGEWTFGRNDDVPVDSCTTDHVLPPDQSVKLQKLIDEAFVRNSREIGCTELVKHVIKTSSAPIKQRYYPISPALLKIVNVEVDKMLQEGIIEPSSSPWSSPIVMVRKKDGSYRFCVDYRKVNSVTVRDAYPLPFISTILDKLRDAKYLTSLDIKSAYWQIPVEEASKEITAFTVPGRGLYHFNRLPFGLHNAPATWQRLIDRVLGPELEPHVFVYLDDIIIVTQDFDKHLEILREVFNRLSNSGLTVARDKCQFCRKSLKFLGFVVDDTGLHVDPEKVSAIVNMPPPQNTTEVRRIIGMASWYRRFIPNFSSVVAPITNLLKKNTKFVWSQECEAAFSSIKGNLVSSPVMCCPDFDKPFVIQTDASDFGLGAVLTQDLVDGEKVISYISRSLSPSERKFSTVEKECLAVVWAINKFRPYVEGTKFTVITDHFSLQWLHKLKEPSGRLARWSVKLQQFDFEIVHRKGSDHVVPDALSRSVPKMALIDFDPADVRDHWYIGMISRVIENPILYPQWRLNDGKLYKRLKRPYPELENPANSWALVVPKDNRKRVMRAEHDSPTAGHAGIHKTFARVSATYYWPRMKADVTQYVKSCPVCAETKPEQKAPPGLLLSRPHVAQPWDLVCIDIVGPLPKSTYGNIFILSVLDYFSKFCLFFPLRSANAKRICRLLEENVFLLFGVPRTLVCDNGKQFVSSEFRGLAKTYSIHISYTPLYHPQANAVERTHRVLKTMLSSYVKDNHRKWEEYLQKVACAIRTSQHEASKVTPFFVNFGREINLTGGRRQNPADDDEPVEIQPVMRAEVLQRVYKDVRQRLDKAYQRSQRIYNLRRRDVSYNVNDRVWRKNYPVSNAARYYSAKLASKYVGPFVIRRRVSPWTYDLITLDGKAAGTWNVKDLKPWHEDVEDQANVDPPNE